MLLSFKCAVSFWKVKTWNTKFKELYWKTWTPRSHDNLLMQFGGHFVSEKRKAIWWANQYFSAAAAAKKEETVELWKPRKNHAAADRRPSIQCHATHRIKRKSARRVFDSVKGKNLLISRINSQRARGRDVSRSALLSTKCGPIQRKEIRKKCI